MAMSSMETDEQLLPLADRLEALQTWFASRVGQNIWRDEKKLLDHNLPGLFGYHLMSLGVCPSLPLSAASPIHHQFTLGPAASAAHVAACCRMHALPIESESVDVAVLHHSLDYSEDPHQLLRETARVLMPYGYVLIFGFQRWSALGLQHMMRQRWCDNDPVANHHFIGLSRLQDWLKLLDFEIIKARHTAYLPPQLGESAHRKMQWFARLAWGAQLPCGSVYFVLARKTVAGVRPVSPSLEKLRLRNPLGALAPQPAVPVIQPRHKRLH